MVRVYGALLGLIGLLQLVGCGSSKSQRATEQLLMSDAVDRAVASIDFRVLAGEKVYLDASYVEQVKGVDFVNAPYIISSLRQQLLAADCRLQDKMENADYVVEARVGALGSDAHDVIYGIPASNMLNNAASLVPGAPDIPAIPEIAFARRNDKFGAAKIGVFAYHRDSRQRVWQSGIADARSTAKDSWLLGIGPIQTGTIYDGTRVVGAELNFGIGQDESDEEQQLVSYSREVNFNKSRRNSEASDVEQDRQVLPANFESPSDGGPADPAGSAPVPDPADN